MKSAALKELAKRIRNARKEARLSQASLGKAIGVSDKSVSAYEQGRSSPPFKVLREIAKETQRPMHYFTDDSTDEGTIVSKLQMIEKELEAIKKLLEKSQK